MIQKLFLLSALLLPAISALAEQDIINKSFDAKAGGTLSMNVDRGSIKVLTANADKVEIEVVRELKRASGEKAREIFDQHEIEFTQNGDTVRIEAENNGGLRNLFNNLQVEYTITIPSKFNVDLNTRGGSISIADLGGEVKVQTAGGSLDIGAISGKISARTAGGNIKIAGGKSDVDAQTSGGSLSIGNIDGKLTAKTSGGNIALEQIKGAVEAQTTGGNVSAELGDQASGECSLKTRGGSVKVVLPEKIAVDLEASTMGGQVTSDFDGEFNKQRTKLVAKINGGGPQMKLSTSGGNVDIRKR